LACCLKNGLELRPLELRPGVEWANRKLPTRATIDLVMVVPAPAEFDGSSVHDHIVCLHNLTWMDYERLLELRGDHSAPRYTYLEGELEIMSPSKAHESVKSMIGRLVEVWCLEKGVEFSTLGSWTLKNEGARRGVEPDECYMFGQIREGATPHLAIEVVWTAGGLDKLRVYEKLGVAEVWFWSRGRIQVYEFREESYAPIDHSRVLSGINLRQLERFIQAPTTSQAIREYRAALRA
jgi:Uma2 family endonuclease